jgi:WD40 repeat protein
LQAHPQNDDWILSVSKDKTVRLWDITNGQCLAIYKTDATVAVSSEIISSSYKSNQIMQCFHPSGDQFITGNYRGELRLWDTVKTSDADKTKTVQESSSRLLKKMNGTCYIGKILKKNTYIET